MTVQGLSVGPGSVSGFGGLAAGGRRYPLGVLTEQLDSYWIQVCVCVSEISGMGFFGGGALVDSDGLDGKPKQAKRSRLGVLQSELQTTMA